MSWRAVLGVASAKVVRAAARLNPVAPRWLSGRERAVLRSVFADSVDLNAIQVRERITGLINLSRSAFVIENTMFVPGSYLPLPDSILVHECTHVWQFQHGGHAYIGDSLHAQTVGDGYDLAKGLREGRSWAQFNCEQQATLIEKAFAQGCFEGRPLIIDGRDATASFESALVALRAGSGAVGAHN